MNVTELINITNRLAVSPIDLTNEEKASYLSFLNMANLELYAIASKGLKTITKRKQIFLDEDSKSFILPDDLYNIRQVFVNKSPLEASEIDEDLDNLKGYLVEGKNLYCDLTVTFLTAVDPSDRLIKKYITLVYCAHPQTLVETVNDPALEIDTPVYPPIYHYFLVHGALYYFYLANRVFMEKSSDIKELWEKDKQELQNFKNYGL